MSSTSLEWEYESSFPCVGRKLFKLLVVGRQFKTFVIVHSSSLLTNFLSYVFTAHCSRALSLSLLSHTHTHTHTRKYMLQPYTHTAPLIWNINLHFSPLGCKLNAHQHSNTISLILSETLSLFLTVSFSSALFERPITYNAFIEQNPNLKLHVFPPLPSLSSPPVNTSSALIKRQKGSGSVARKWKWHKQRWRTKLPLPVRSTDGGNTKI